MELHTNGTKQFFFSCVVTTPYYFFFFHIEFDESAKNIINVCFFLLNKGYLPIYDDDVSKWTIILDQFYTFTDANTRWNYVHIEYTFDIFCFTLWREEFNKINKCMSCNAQCRQNEMLTKNEVRFDDAGIVNKHIQMIIVFFNPLKYG